MLYPPNLQMHIGNFTLKASDPLPAKERTRCPSGADALSHLLPAAQAPVRRTRYEGREPSAILPDFRPAVN